MSTSAPKMPAAPSAPAPSEALKQVTVDQQAARDNSLRRIGLRLSLNRTNATSGMGLTNEASTTNKTMLGQ
jgi:hypothetical protein